MEHTFQKVNGINIHYVTEGSGPLVVLLHGFPENAYSWRHQIPALSKNFKVVAPDLRGYGETDKPQDIPSYRLDNLVSDLTGLIQALGYQKAHIIGHDWGGAVAWACAITKPQFIDHMIILNSPHPQIFGKALRTNLRQMLRSWYIYFFLLPRLPEYFFKLSPKKFMDQVFGKTLEESDIAKYQEPLEKPGAFTAALNYYRAALSNRHLLPKRKITVPTLLIWGEEDPALGKELTYNMEPLFSGPFQIAYLPHAGHFVHEERPDQVNRLLLPFLTSSQK